MTQSMPSPAEQLCLSCGMCCSGSLHNWTYLQPEEAARAGRLGLEVIHPTPRQARMDPRPVFRQPCRALDGTVCQVYSQRPQACRQYTCHIFRRLESGELNLESALELVHKTRELVDLLREKMAYPFDFLSLDWQLRVNWPPGQPLPEDVQPIFSQLTALLKTEWLVNWRRRRRKQAV